MRNKLILLIIFLIFYRANLISSLHSIPASSAPLFRRERKVSDFRKSNYAALPNLLKSFSMNPSKAFGLVGQCSFCYNEETVCEDCLLYVLKIFQVLKVAPY